MNLTFSFSLSASFCSAFAFHSAKNYKEQTEFYSSQYSRGVKFTPISNFLVRDKNLDLHKVLYKANRQ